MHRPSVEQELDLLQTSAPVTPSTALSATGSLAPLPSDSRGRLRATQAAARRTILLADSGATACGLRRGGWPGR